MRYRIETPGMAQTYDGGLLPFDQASLDYVYSQPVNTQQTSHSDALFPGFDTRRFSLPADYLQKAMTISSGGTIAYPKYSADAVAPTDISSGVTGFTLDAGAVPGLTSPPVLLVREGEGPPAIEEGPLLEALQQPRTGLRGWRYASGRVIVRFSDGTSGASRLTSLRTSSSRAASFTARPASADFDIVTIGPDEDAEAVAARFRGQPGVEYAQAAYVNHAMLVPNDPLYAKLQWNFPLIDLERA
jgi:hypothetical protein